LSLPSVFLLFMSIQLLMVLQNNNLILGAIPEGELRNVLG